MDYPPNKQSLVSVRPPADYRVLEGWQSCCRSPTNKHQDIWRGMNIPRILGVQRGARYFQFLQFRYFRYRGLLIWAVPISKWQTVWSVDSHYVLVPRSSSDHYVRDRFLPDWSALLDLRAWLFDSTVARGSLMIWMYQGSFRQLEYMIIGVALPQES